MYDQLLVQVCDVYTQQVDSSPLVWHFTDYELAGKLVVIACFGRKTQVIIAARVVANVCSLPDQVGLVSELILELPHSHPVMSLKLCNFQYNFVLELHLYILTHKEMHCFFLKM